MVVVPVIELALLVAVDAIVGGVEVENEFFGRASEGGDELIDKDAAHSCEASAGDAILEAAEGRR